MAASPPFRPWAPDPRCRESRPFLFPLGGDPRAAPGEGSKGVAQYFQLGLGYSPMRTGLRLLPWTATPLVIAPLAGKLSDRIGRRPILSLGTLLQGVGIEWLAILASVHVNYSALVPPLILSGVGISMALPVAPTAALSAVPPGDIGKASGVNSSLQRFGSVFAVAVATAVFGAFGKLGAADTFLSGFRPALGVVGALALLASVTALAVTSGPSLGSDGRRGRRAQEEIGADTPFEGPIFSTTTTISSGRLTPAPPADSGSPSPNQPSAGNDGGPKTRSCNDYVA